jgi:hypothetical protein
MRAGGDPLSHLRARQDGVRRKIVERRRNEIERALHAKEVA